MLEIIAGAILWPIAKAVVAGAVNKGIDKGSDKIFSSHTKEYEEIREQYRRGTVSMKEAQKSVRSLSNRTSNQALQSEISSWCKAGMPK